MVWTQFWDMHSGGGTKVSPYDKIYIEAPEKEATSVFYARFGFNPNRVTCTCCGEDYSITEYKTFKKATEFQRNDFVDKKFPPTGERFTVAQYKKWDSVKVIYAKDIEPDETKHTPPEEGYVWR